MEENSNVSVKSTKKELFEWIGAILVAAILAYVIRNFLFSPFIIDGRSMERTLLDGERVMVNELVLNFHDPEHGDVIVFAYDEEYNFIKRVIGIAGDIVEVKDDELYINGEIVPEPYLENEKESLQKAGYTLTEDFGPVEVEEGKLFVMGDNRDNSMDSREIGTISIDQIIGRADLIFWPLSDINLINN